MNTNTCVPVVFSNTADGTINITKGETIGYIIVDVKNKDGESTSICITKKELNDITKLVNKIL